MTVVARARGVNSHQFVQTWAQVGIVAALVRLESTLIDVDDPTNAAGVLAFCADAAKGVVGPGLEPFDRRRH